MWAMSLAAGQVVARLDPQIQQNALRSAQANLSSAEAQLTQARLTFWRQQELLKDGWTPRAQFDEAQQAFQTAQAQVDCRAGAGAHRAGPAELHGLARPMPRARSPRSAPNRAKWSVPGR